MTPKADILPDAGDRSIVEGTARVVSVENGEVWLEPEQTKSCGHCHASKACGVEPGSRRLVARRFSLPDENGLRAGDRVVIGVDNRTLVRAAVTAYCLPLLTMLVAGVSTQKLGGGDGEALTATLAGLAIGLLLVRWRAHRLTQRGELTPHFIRRAFGPGPGGDCHDMDG